MHVLLSALAASWSQVTDADFPERFNGLSKSHAIKCAKDLPSGLMDDDQSLSLTRAAIKRAGDVDTARRRLYTDWELRQALVAVAAGDSRPAAVRRWGVPERTLDRYLVKLRHALGVSSNKDMKRLDTTKVEEAVNALDIAKLGRQHLYHHVFPLLYHIIVNSLAC